MRIEQITPASTFSHFGHVTLVVKDVSNDELKLLKALERTYFDVEIKTIEPLTDEDKKEIGLIE